MFFLSHFVDFQNCCWCRRPVPENAPEFLTTSDGPRYCSESCFTQSRRASFKKAKTCDWCKHIRHAVSYVDFHDGATQLQFCSDKCLNQYKMQIFCKETQAHLDMNPHLKEQGLDAANNGANLITPDLWLKNCRSRSASPASTVSTSPGPNIGERSARSNTPLSPPKVTVSNNSPHPSNTNYKPMISVAPVSKLMSKSPGIMPSRQSPKHNRKKRPLKTCAPAESGNSRTENKTNCASTAISIKPKPIMGVLSDTNRTVLNQANTPSLTQFANSCVQDLHMNVPPLSPMLESPASQPTTPHNIPTANTGRCSTTIPPAFFATPPNITGPPNAAPPVQTPVGFPPRPPFLHNTQTAPGLWPRFLGNFSSFPQPPSTVMPPELPALNALIGTPPPVTVMVPYPVIIPLPIPIPVPLPLVDFYKAHLSPEERKKFEESRNIKTETMDTSNSTANSNLRSPSATEEPLDFTKTKGVEETVDDELSRNDILLEPAVDNFMAKEEIETAQTTTSNPPSNEATTTPKIMQCIINSNETLNHPDTAAPDIGEESENVNGNGNMKSSIIATTISNDLINEETNEETNQRLPKLKITRLQTKRLIQTKESECSRPLRKRKRIIDCDFQKIAAANNRETNDDSVDNVTATTTDIESNSKSQTK